MFSILIVCLNPGNKLKDTLQSILNQEETDYEIVIKDGLSTDGSLDQLQETEKLHIYKQKDSGIYFLNCGDYFYHSKSLAEIKQGILKTPGRKIYYGNAYFRRAKTIIHVPKVIDDFACYRNIPCHQACVFEKSLFTPKGFTLDYKIRADYDFFLRAYFTQQVKPNYIDTVIADYEGGGFSESKGNQKRDKIEHRTITSLYMKKSQLFRYRLFMFFTFQKLRKYIAERSAFSGVYDKVKSRLYK